MTVRTVRLDDESEHMLTEIRKATGQSTSEVLRHGVALAHQELRRERSAEPYTLYAELDLGPGGYAAAPARQARRGARGTVAKRRKR